jgi:hypothetical protein
VEFPFSWYSKIIRPLRIDLPGTTPKNALIFTAELLNTPSRLCACLMQKLIRERVEKLREEIAQISAANSLYLQSGKKPPGGSPTAAGEIAGNLAEEIVNRLERALDQAVPVLFAPTSPTAIPAFIGPLAAAPAAEL